MPNRRFALLAGVLVALNLFLWLVPEGLAVRQMIATQIFGPKLVRAQVTDSCGGTCTSGWGVDRGVITNVSLGQFVITEADTRLQTFVLTRATRVIGGTRRSLAPGWRVLVTWPLTSATTPAAATVEIEKRGRLRG